MVRILVIGCLVYTLSLVAVAAEEKKDVPSPAKSAAAERYLKAPHDRKLFEALFVEVKNVTIPLMSTDPDAALKQLDELEQLFRSVNSDSPEAQQLRTTGIESVAAGREDLEVIRTPLDELAKRALAAPDEHRRLNMFWRKSADEIRYLARTDTEQALAKVKAMREVGIAVLEKCTRPELKQSRPIMEKQLANLEQWIDQHRKYASLVGKPATPLEIDTWIDGKRLAAEDLKGKVVLLDFWAVWCPGCITKFPQLREWHEKYVDKGLVIVALTDWYNYEWDDATNQPKQSDGPVPHAVEASALGKFAKQHMLPFAVGIPRDRTLVDFYGAKYLPHMVVIDQDGKIRMSRASGEEVGTKDVAALLEELLASPKPLPRQR